MFQFPSFPFRTYEFSTESTSLQRRCSHIRKSPDRCLFTAPRSLSQFVTSFVGSWCQGIHLMLFPAWTSCSLVLTILAWRFAICFLLVVFQCFQWKDFLPLKWFCVFTHYLILERPIFYNCFSLICSFAFIRFSMNVFSMNLFTLGWHKWTRTTDLALIRRAL